MGQKAPLPGYEFVDSSFTAVAWAEGFEEAPCDDAVVEAWQYLVDTGLAWTLQGWFGRTAMGLIEAGVIHKKTD